MIMMTMIMIIMTMIIWQQLHISLYQFHLLGHTKSTHSPGDGDGDGFDDDDDDDDDEDDDDDDDDDSYTLAAISSTHPPTHLRLMHPPAKSVKHILLTNKFSGGEMLSEAFYVKQIYKEGQFRG